jgi:hypothetical protein
MFLSRASYACSSIIMKHLKRNLNDSQFYKLSEILVDLLKVANPANEIRGLNRKLKFRKKKNVKHIHVGEKNDGIKFLLIN